MVPSAPTSEIVAGVTRERYWETLELFVTTSAEGSSEKSTCREPLSSTAAEATDFGGASVADIFRK